MERKNTGKKAIKETLEELFKLLGIEGDFDFTKNEDGVDVVLNTQESGIVIGYHGEILEALAMIASFCVSKKIGRFIHVSIDVGDYKKNRTDILKNIALQTKDKVLQEKKELSLPNLKSWERRAIHMFLQEDPDVISESIGEGRERTLIIKLRQTGE